MTSLNLVRFSPQIEREINKRYHVDSARGEAIGCTSSSVAAAACNSNGNEHACGSQTDSLGRTAHPPPADQGRDETMRKTLGCGW